jgi:hypothetical protein
MRICKTSLQRCRFVVASSLVIYILPTVKPGYKDLGYKDNLTNKDTILGPEYICMRNKDNPIPLNILLIGRSLASKHTKFSLT